MRKPELKPEDGIESTPGPGGTRAAPLQASWAGLQWVPQCVSVDPALGEAAPSPAAVGIAPLASEIKGRVSGSPGLDYVVIKKEQEQEQETEKQKDEKRSRLWISPMIIQPTLSQLGTAQAEPFP